MSVKTMRHEFRCMVIATAAICAGAASAAPASVVRASCGRTDVCFTLVEDYGPRQTLVGTNYATASAGFASSYAFSTNATSTLGVGFSYSGTSGSLSASGTQTSTASNEVTFPTLSGYGGRYYYYTNYRYGEFYGTGCSPSGTFYYEARATGFAGGAAVNSGVGIPSATNCVSYTSGSSFTKSNSVATNWSNGVSMSGVIGINLSAQTGYTSSSKLSYTFSSTRQLCGTADYPGGSPKEIVVK